jgi:hypothetical protein
MDWNFIFSIITAGSAIIALFQTKSQIQIGNKQHLFDKRVENFMIFSGLFQLYASNRRHFVEYRKDAPELPNDLYFYWLTNNTFLEGISGAIKNPLKEPFHKEFLIKLEELKSISIQIKFLFSGEASLELNAFISRYQELLFSMYQYQIILNKMSENAEKNRMTLEEAQRSVGEPAQRKELYVAQDNLEQVYQKLLESQTVVKIEKQIKL